MAVQTSTLVIGNLTSNPEVRYLNDGTAVVNFSVASNSRKWNQQTSKYDEELDAYYRASAWRDFGLNVAQSLSRGDRVIMVGKMVMRKYTDKNGVEQTAWQMEVDDLGPSLRFASCEVKRNARPSQQAAYTNQQAQQQPAAQAAPQGQQQPQGQQPVTAPLPVAPPEDDIPF